MKIGKFLKNIVKGVEKAISKTVPVLAVATLFSPTLFGLAGKKGVVGSIARGLLGLTRTKGKIDPKKVTALLLGASMLESAQRQRQAERMAQRALEAQQAWWQQTLTPMTGLTNQLLSSYTQFLTPFMFPPSGSPQQIEDFLRQFPTFFPPQ